MMSTPMGHVQEAAVFPHGGMPPWENRLQASQRGHVHQVTESINGPQQESIIDTGQSRRKQQVDVQVEGSKDILKKLKPTT
ncbi:hypothetical protein GOP47_0023913 [Adiantum capillus-veneris]|uniref:Uncharacterized protein n=1 Tax=Adiantum capillus-veneris TaxID=13818 RepID=A0A9D4U4L4_ADICA|nr:hypothetical protein GOP47_0023913 [Adiantum capillus-veneris]